MGRRAMANGSNSPDGTGYRKDGKSNASNAAAANPVLRQTSLRSRADPAQRLEFVVVGDAWPSGTDSPLPGPDRHPSAHQSSAEVRPVDRNRCAQEWPGGEGECWGGSHGSIGPDDLSNSEC